MQKFPVRLLFSGLITSCFVITVVSCGGKQKGSTFIEKIESVISSNNPDDEYTVVNSLLVIPRNPVPGEEFRIVATGGRNITKSKVVLRSPNREIESQIIRTGSELPCWRIDAFSGVEEGNYQAILTIDGTELAKLAFDVMPQQAQKRNGIWETTNSWDSHMETIYSAWINALFQGSNEQTSWNALHEVTQSREKNFLYNHLSMGEDDTLSQNHVLMEPDCADNPFFLRAYFAWKLGLPFGYHISDRGYLGKSPQTGQWVTNESASSKKHPVLAFNAFIRNIMNGVHSGTARTAFNNDNSDYYPVALNRESLRPGTVFADPYGHTLTIVSWVPQTKEHPGQLLAVDAQPDKSIAIKRFWRGNFLFSTSEVVGEPGFKAFRPIVYSDGKVKALKNETLHAGSGFVPFSLQQQKMDRDTFYLAIERIINPKPLDAEDALMDLIKALHEQLLVRVKSVANGEAYMKSHPGTIIPMPSSAKGVFLAGGPWEDFSTPNRDLRLLIAMDAVLNFPDRVATSPQDFKVPSSATTDELRNKLKTLLDKKVAELTIGYTRSDGSQQELTVAEILKRRDAFEMAYNPNDCPEIRWGAPENSKERSTCRRMAPPYQQKTMQAVREWFGKRLHPPT